MYFEMPPETCLFVQVELLKIRIALQEVNDPLGLLLNIRRILQGGIHIDGLRQKNAGNHGERQDDDEENHD
jgi:hypothetical protein